MFEIRQGDALEVLRTLPDESVNCCITSPPYYGLRDYGTAKWEGGDAECEHRNHSEHQKQGANSQRAGRSNTEDQRNENFRDICPLCGARRIDAQIGLERTPSEYIARLVEVFREVRRVLKSDGTLWVNIGDSYARPAAKGQRGPSPKQDSNTGTPQAMMTDVPPGLKEKDLIGIPWLLAFALRDEGWYLRQDCIWAKPNPMPESVRDRCTKSHEYVFLLTKSARYWWDAEAIAEPVGTESLKHIRVRPNGSPTHARLARVDTTCGTKPEGRNHRSVWTLATQPTPEAHFATFPLELPELCLKAGCPEGGVVLDPFAGAGTTGLACLKNGRRFLGIELNPAYVEIAQRRAEKYYPLLIQDQLSCSMT